MSNALSSQSANAAPPDPQAQTNALSQKDMPGPAPPMGSPMANGAGPGGMPPQAQGGAQPQAPAPSHQQTVAALRHFDAIEKQLTTALQDPDVGRSDIKSKVIDGMTRLVADGIFTPAQAVKELGSFPEKPFDQKGWLMQHLQQTVQAATMVLHDHQTAFAGQAVDTTPPDPAQHTDMIQGLAQHYRGKQRA